MNSTKETIRIVTLRGKGIKKKCRKTEWFFCEGIGTSEESAMQALKKDLHRKLDQMRSYELDNSFYSYESEREINPGYSWIVRYPFATCDVENHKVKFYEIDVILNLVYEWTDSLKDSLAMV